MTHKITFSQFTSKAAVEGSIDLSGSVTLVIEPVFAESLLRNKALSAQSSLEGFKGEVGQTILSSTLSSDKVVHKLVVGLGELGADGTLLCADWREALIAAFKKAATYSATTVILTLSRSMLLAYEGEAVGEFGKVIGTTVEQVLYQPNHFKTEKHGYKAKPRIENVIVKANNISANASRRLMKGIEVGATIGTAINMARDTANMPANKCRPCDMSQLAFDIAAQSNGTITTQSYSRKYCESAGMNAFVAVAKGSDEPLEFIIMDYHPAGIPDDAPILALVGKSVTFDAGGLDIKPADGMRDMKYDMCGGADVIATMWAIAQLKLPVHVRAYCAATENMINGVSFRPGDVYVGLDKRSYEIDNTDAEGRLTLVDAIAYAVKYDKVSKIVDYATLTGAVLIALGDSVAGVVTNNQEWCDQYLAAAKATGEWVHQFPVHPDYKKQNESKIADLKNTGGRLAGSITAGLFVISAAGDVPIVHVDIAGTAFRSRATGADPEGGTGFGVMTLIELATRFNGEN